MEDLNAGRLKPTVLTKSTGPRKGHVDFAFPARRVLVLGGTHHVGLDVVRAFLKIGCKVAVIDSDKEKGDALAYKEGIRYYNVDSGSGEAMTSALINIIEAWRDIDILIVTEFHEALDNLINIWTSHRKRFPVPYGYSGRVILIYAGLDKSDCIIKSCEINNAMKYGINLSEVEEKVSQLSHGLHNYRISVNAIVNSEQSISESRDPARICLSISLPGNDFISELIIPAKM
ncbi:MAG: SDR family NAD(P)-dependent oxidoreductase [Lachnospiraceae bacterium]|nr:SDR family NAD(P)-dependent oxidoreductase [Lachnospiraceae bacterium]